MGWIDPDGVSDPNARVARFGAARCAGPPNPAGGRAPGDLPGCEVESARAETAPPGGTLPAEWFHRYFDVLWRLVARLGVAGHSIDDVVQETFIAASRRHADIHEGQERRFLIGTAVRLSSNHRQRAHVRQEVSDSERLELEACTVPDAERLLIEKQLRSLLDEVLASLSDSHREIFVLYELEGFSTPEIAEILGIPLGTVASRLARARSSFSRAAARSLHTDPK